MDKSFKYIQDQTEDLIEAFAERNRQNFAMDNMANSRWELPGTVNKEFVRKSISPAPSNALITAIKVLSAETPKIRFTPIGPHPDDRATASKIERGLLWELRSSAKRSQTKLIPDIVRSSLLYGEAAVYVDYLPWRLKGQVNQKRMNRILRSGNFALIPHNPSTVYPLYSPLGLESVTVVKDMTASTVRQYWGDVAKELDPILKKEKSDFTVKYYDYVDEDRRVVWLVAKEKQIVLLDEKRNLSFIPWAIRMTGTGLENSPGAQRTPFLSTVYKTKMWDTLNILQSLVNSEVIGYAAAPRMMIIGPNGETVAVDYGDINKPLRVPPGHTAVPMQPPAIDRALTEIFDRTKADLDAATSVQVLQNLNFPAGTAYATINAVLQTAIASLQPFKVLSEMNLADIFEIMLLWIDETDGEIFAYGTGKEKGGEVYKITKDDFNATQIYIDVELNASAPTDFMQRINAGTLMYQLGYPKSRVFEDLNVPDPEQAILERFQEDLIANEIALAIQQRQMETMQPPQQNLQNMQMGPPPSPGFENVKGQGFDPNMGGEPPSVAASGLTREELNGITSGGQPIAEV